MRVSFKFLKKIFVLFFVVGAAVAIDMATMAGYSDLNEDEFEEVKK